MSSNYKMLESVRLKYLAGFTPQSWFLQISYRFPSKVAQHFLQILIVNFFCPSKALLKQPKDNKKITLLGIFFLLTEMEFSFCFWKELFLFFSSATRYDLFNKCKMPYCRVQQSPQMTAPSLDGDLNTAWLEYWCSFHPSKVFQEILLLAQLLDLVDYEVLNAIQILFTS